MGSFKQSYRLCNALYCRVFFVLSALQARKGIREATLVFIALSFVFVSMVFRILLIDESPFMRRYGLIIAFAVE